MIDKRDGYIDAVKGIGIISIVLGHSVASIRIANIMIPIGAFVYLYHLAIFAFCTGYVYKDTDEKLWQFIGRRIKSIYYPYLKYVLIYIVILRPLCIKMGIIDANYYSISELLIAITNALVFNNSIELMGAMWFAPMIFFAVIIFATIEKKVKKINLERKIIFIISVGIVGIVGLYATDEHMWLNYSMQIAYLFVPIIFGGYISKKIELRKYCNIWLAIITGIIMFLFLKSNHGMIELSQYMIISKFLFYPITMIGILFCLSFTNFLCKNGKMEKCLACIGKNSFDIMALHFIFFKLIDFVICNVYEKKDVISNFPHSFTSIWFIYLLAGVVGPILVKKFLVYIWRGTKANENVKK